MLELPPGTEVTSITAHGASFWTRTARLDAQLGGGEKVQYFLKVPGLFEVSRAVLACLTLLLADDLCILLMAIAVAA